MFKLKRSKLMFLKSRKKRMFKGIKSKICLTGYDFASINIYIYNFNLIIFHVLLIKNVNFRIFKQSFSENGACM